MRETYVCEACGQAASQPRGAVNRARKLGRSLYCNRACAGLARRRGKTKAQLVAEKAAYDREYRKRDPEGLKARKHEYHKRTYDPAAAAVVRKKNMARHVAYCRRPEYRKRKSEYDRDLRAREFGAFGDAHRVLVQLKRLICEREPDKYQRAKARGYYLRTATRGRAHARN